MKNLPIFIALSLLALGCTETIFVEVPGKTDTLKIEKFVDRVFQGVDTTEVPVTVQVPVPTRVQDTVITLTDTVYVDRVDTLYITETVYVPRVDSIFVTKTIYLTDTIMVREYHWGDTLFQYIFYRGAFGLPTELEEQYGEFFAEVDRRGITYQGSGSALLIAYRPMDDALQAYSFEYGNQIGLFINDKLTVDESYIPLFRELSRIFLKNEYSLDDSNPMSQRFPSDLIRWSNRQDFTNEIALIFE